MGVGPWRHVIEARGESFPGGKVCSKCLKWKPFSDYWKHPKCQFGLRPTCKVCNRTAADIWRQAHPEAVRSLIIRHHGIGLVEYDQLLKKQKNRCVICKHLHEDRNGGRLVIDHDHKTGVIRGLLCQSCNKGIGHFRDDVALIKKAARYVKLKGQVYGKTS